MKKIGNKIFSAEINSPCGFRTAYPYWCNPQFMGPAVEYIAKWGVDNSFFTVKLANIQKFLPQLPHQTLRFLKITVNIVNRSGSIDQILGNWITFFLSHISSCDIVAALPWLICNVWGTLFVSSNGRRRREYMWWEGILFIPSKNNSGIQIK